MRRTGSGGGAVLWFSLGRCGDRLRRHPARPPAAGSCAVPRGPLNQDWVLVLKAEKQETAK